MRCVVCDAWCVVVRCGALWCVVVWCVCALARGLRTNSCTEAQVALLHSEAQVVLLCVVRVDACAFVCTYFFLKHSEEQ